MAQRLNAERTTNRDHGRVWSSLRIWTNTAHDGVYDAVAKPGEVKTLDELGIVSFDVVNYDETPIVDGHGNKQ